MNITPEYAWRLYLEIDENIRKSDHQQIEKLVFGLDHALQRLCQAVLIKFDLKKENYPQVVYHNNPLDVKSIRQLDLSSLHAMVNARVVEWEEAREETFYAGTDDDSPGGPGNDDSTRTIPAAFIPQESIQDCLRLDYFELVKCLNTTAKEALAFYRQIDNCARQEIVRLSRCDITFQKERQIDLALQRLHQAILKKYDQKKPDQVSFTTTIDPDRVKSLTLYSIDSMLDAKIYAQEGSPKILSLRQILNISRLNPLNIFWYQEAYWGEATALQRFKQSIQQQELNPIN